MVFDNSYFVSIKNNIFNDINMFHNLLLKKKKCIVGNKHNMIQLLLLVLSVGRSFMATECLGFRKECAWNVVITLIPALILQITPGKVHCMTVPKLPVNCINETLAFPRLRKKITRKKEPTFAAFKIENFLEILLSNFSCKYILLI